MTANLLAGSIEPATSGVHRRLHLTFVNSVKTSKVDHVNESWNDLVARLTRKPVIVHAKSNVDSRVLKWPLFVPFKMLTEAEGARMRDTDYGLAYSRCRANVEYMDALVLDFDNDPKKSAPHFSIQDAKTQFAGLAYVLYTSFNHRNPYKHNVDKFRVVLPLAAPVGLDEGQSRREALMALFPSADPMSFTASQPFYVPIAHPDRASLYESFEGHGKWFDLIALEPTAKPEPKPAATYVQTGDKHKDLPFITLKGGATYQADDLWNFLQEGYEHRRPCFRVGGADKNAGCFVYRKGSGLMYFDPTAAKGTFIRVMKTQKTGLRDDDGAEAETALTLVRKPKAPGQQAPREIVKVPVRRRAAAKTIEYVDRPFELLQLDRRYLPDDLHLSIPVEGITAIRSPKGTGKTFLLKSVVAECNEKGRSVLLLGHRVYLLKDLAVRTNLTYYRDIEDGQTTPWMALCMNSLTRIDPKVDEPYDTVIIDESEQVFQALVSKTLQRDLSIVINNLMWLFFNAKRVICLDADLSAELTIELIQELRGIKPGDGVLAVINNYRIGEGQTTKLYEKKMHLLADALAAIESGEKAFIACNSRKFATIIDAIVKQTGKTSLLVTAETNEQQDTQAFIENPTEESKSYDVVVASPTLSTGVSIEGNHFTKVYGFFGIKPGTYQDVDQALSRVRNCGDVAVWVQGNKRQPLILREEQIYDRALNIERGSLKRLWDEDAMLTQGQLTWARIYARITYIIQDWSVNKDEQFSRLRQELGFKIEPIMGDDDANRAGCDIFNSFKNIDVDRAAALFDAVDLDEDEAAKLGRKRQRSHDEQLALEKYRLHGHLANDWTMKNVRKALKQELLQSLARVQTLHAIPDTVREKEDRQDRARNSSTFTANRHRTMQRDLLEHLYGAGKIDVTVILDKVAAAEEVEISRESLLAVANAYAERMRDFNYYFECRIKDPTDEKNVKKVWDATIGHSLSLPLIRKKRGTKAKREYRYYIDASKKDLVLKAARTMEDSVRRFKNKRRA